MMKSNSILFGVLILLCCLSGVLAADNVKSTEAVRRQSALLEKEEELRLASVEFKSFAKKLDLQTAALDGLREGADERLSQLSLMLLTSYASPYDFRLLCKEVFAKTEEAVKCVRATDTLLEEFADNDVWTCNMIRSLSAPASTNDSPASAMTRQRMLDMLVGYQALLNRSHTELVRASENFKPYLKKWNDLSAKYEAKIPDRLAWILLYSRCSIFEADTWMSLLPAISEWAAAAPLTVRAKLPDNASAWVILFFWMLGGAIAISTGSAVRRRLSPRISSLVSGSHLGRAWFCFFAAIPLLCAVLSMEFPQTVLLTRLALALLAIAVMDFAWSIRTPDSGGNSPLVPLFWLYFAGVILQVLNVNTYLLTFAWLLCCAVVISGMVSGLSSQTHPMGRHMLRASIAVCAVLMALSASGYTMLSMLFAYLWFISLLAFQFGVFASRLMTRLIRTGGGGAGEVARAIVNGICVPALWFILVGCAMAWVADQFIELNAFWKMLSAPRQIGKVTLSVPLIAACVFLFFVVKAILGALDGVIEKLLASEGIRSREQMKPFKTVSFWLAWTVYAIIVLGMAGVTLTSLTVIAGGLSVGAGFGLQNLVNNFTSGMIILFGKTVRHGEVIQLPDGRPAIVHEINMRNTIVKTYDNMVVTIPNSELMSKEIVSFNHYDAYFRTEIKIGASYDADLGKAVSLLKKAAAENPRVMKSPAPSVIVSDLGDSAVEFVLRVWIDLNDDPYAQSELRTRIIRDFTENGIEIPYPQLDVAMRQRIPVEPAK